MNGSPADSRMRDLCREVITALKEVFAEHVVGYAIDEAVDAPYPSAKFRFELYGYYPMIFQYDRGYFGFTINFAQPVSIPLAIERSADLKREGAMTELVELLRDAVLLRIPDKYLHSIGA